MPLSSGSKLVHYEILGPLGAGAMGEVYRAKDSKLGREVAIKVLPEHFVDDEERLKRFEREAKTLASLNHPNVAQIFGVDQVGDTCFLVLELVPGEALDERLRRGPLPLDEALEVAKQIAEGLEAAHEAGVIHRDLKPANVRVTPDGKVKVLDFGLAKPAGESQRGSSTDSVLSTEAGRLLGTPTYMAPEQARGKAIDKRVDIWAFGCVLYECLTAKRAFHGETLTDVLGSVLHSQADLAALPAHTPKRVRELLTRCFDKDPRRRLRDIGDARIELEHALRDPRDGESLPIAAAPPSATASRARWPWWLAGAIALALIALPLWLDALRRDRDEPDQSAQAHPAPVVRFEIDVPAGYRIPEGVDAGIVIALHPAGDRVVFAAEADHRTQLFVREMASDEARPLPHTEGASNPCFSPDGKWLGFASGTRLMKIPATGGPAITLCQAPNNPSMAWLDDGTIVWSGGTSGLWRVSAEGGEPKQLAKCGPDVRTADGETVVLGFDAPLGVPGASYLLSSAWNGDTTESYVLIAVSLVDGSMRTVMRGTTAPSFLAPDRLLFMRGSTLMTIGFDPTRGVVKGEPTVVLDGVRTDQWTDTAYVGSSLSGSIAYVPGGRLGSGRRLIRVDDSGAVTPLLDGTDLYLAPPAISPDGRRAVFTTLRHKVEVWALDIERHSVALVSSLGENQSLAWSPDSASIYTLFFPPQQAACVARWAVSGGEPPEILPGTSVGETYPQQALPDGSGLLVRTISLDATNSSDLALYRFADASMTPVRNRPATEGIARLSPNGKWLAYASDETGRMEMYLGPLGANGPNQRVSTNGGTLPRFSPDGKRLCFIDSESRMMAASLEEKGSELRAAAPVELFDCKKVRAVLTERNGYDVFPDGGFAMVQHAAWEEEPLVLRVVLNLLTELRADEGRR